MRFPDVVLMERQTAMIALMIKNPVETAMVIMAMQYAIEQNVRRVAYRRLALGMRDVVERLAEGT